MRHWRALSMCRHSAASGAGRDRSHIARGRGPATDGGVTEMHRGVFGGWVADPLGYSLADPLRDRTDVPALSQRVLAPAAAVSAPRSPTERPRSGATHDDRRLPPLSLYGPLPHAAVSPVFEWDLSLWQWRPLHVAVHVCRSAAVEVRCGTTADQGCGAPSRRPTYFQAPFLLRLTPAPRAMRPVVHPAVCHGIQACLRAQHAGAFSLHGITLPTPVGHLGLDILHTGTPAASPHEDDCASAVLAPPGPQSCADAVADTRALPPPAPPPAENWDAFRAATDAGTGDDSAAAASTYTHVFAEDGVAVRRRDGRRVPFSRARCSAIGGGLAALLLSVDRYAALVARGELTVSAACWAALCDTTSAEVLQHLRVSASAVECEVVMATAAHRRWQEHARARHRTLVGKSSHGVTFCGYPTLAGWPPLQIPGSG